MNSHCEVVQARLSCTGKLNRSNLLNQGKTCFEAACGARENVLSTFPALATVVLSRFADVPQVCRGEAGTNLCCYCFYLRLLLAKTSPSIADSDLALLPSKDDRGLSWLPSERLAAKSVLGCKSLRGAHGFEWMHRHVAPKQSVESGQNLLRSGSLLKACPGVQSLRGANRADELYKQVAPWQSVGVGEAC